VQFDEHMYYVVYKENKTIFAQVKRFTAQYRQNIVHARQLACRMCDECSASGTSYLKSG